MDSSKRRDEAKAWLRNRLVTETFANEWETLLRASLETFTKYPLEKFISQQDINRIFYEFFTPEVLSTLQQELLQPVFHHLAGRLKTEATALEDWTSQETIEHLVKLVEAPGVVQKQWVEQFFKQDAVSEVLVDSIYSALREFSTIIPRLVLRSLPSGRFKALGLAGNLTEKIASQLEKIIEPEIRAFLSSSSQSLITRACEFTVGQLDSPTSRTMRANLFRYGIKQELSFHVSGLDEGKLSLCEAALEQHFKTLAENSVVREAIEGELSEFYSLNKQRCLADVLPQLTEQLVSRSSLFAEISFPILVNVLEIPQVNQWLDSLVDEFLDAYEK